MVTNSSDWCWNWKVQISIASSQSSLIKLVSSKGNLNCGSQSETSTFCWDDVNRRRSRICKSKHLTLSETLWGSWGLGWVANSNRLLRGRGSDKFDTNRTLLPLTFFLSKNQVVFLLTDGPIANFTCQYRKYVLSRFQYFSGPLLNYFHHMQCCGKPQCKQVPMDVMTSEHVEVQRQVSQSSRPRAPMSISDLNIGDSKDANWKCKWQKVKIKSPNSIYFYFTFNKMTSFQVFKIGESDALMMHLR